MPRKRKVGKLKAGQFYCVACGRKTYSDKTRDAKARVTGQAMIKGKCKHCSNKVCRFVPN